MELNLLNPFPGLRPFEPNESHLFFGRERHIDEIIKKLDVFRFVSVVGNSGSGKSSLIKAGLLPHISKTRPQWSICILRPGMNPLKSLESALVEESLTNEVGIEDTLAKSKLGLVQILRKEVSKDRPLLILVDQFEELFRFNSLTESKEEYEVASHFVDLLLAATEQNDVPIYVIITLRSDFLGDCEQFIGLPEAINDGQFLVPRMNRNELQSSLINPVKFAQGKISPRLVQNLLNQVGNSPDQLPVLQHVLMRSFDVWLSSGQIEQPMDLDHYEQTGGMNRALSIHAEEAYNELTDGQKKIAEHIFRTITVKGSDNRGIRRPTAIKNIAAIANCSSDDVIQVANVFRRSDRGFITPAEKVELNEESVLDISHESLMRKWDLLGTWVDMEGNSADLYKRICESAGLYEEDKASLWRDPDLQIARDWLDADQPNEAWAKQYNDMYRTAMRFIEASIQQKVFLLEDKRRKRRIRNIIVLAVLIVLSGLSLWAFNERNNATAYAMDALEKQQEADAQKRRAEINLLKAQEEEEKASIQQQEAERQRLIAEANASNAKKEATKSKMAEAQAELERLKALEQKQISDNLRTLAEQANMQSDQLRKLSIAQNLAIRSKLIQDGASLELKKLLALHAYRFNSENGGRLLDKEIFEALSIAYRGTQVQNDYLFRMHKDEVQSVAFNASGDLTSVGSDGRIVLNNLKTRQLKIRNDEEHAFDNLVYAPNEDKFAVVNEKDEIMLFSSGDIQEPLHVIRSVNQAKIMQLIWSSEQILSFSLDSTLRIYHAATGELQKTVPLGVKPFSAHSFTRSGELLIGGEDGNIHVLNLDKSSTKLLLQIGKGKINCLDYDDEQKLIAFGTNGGYAGIVDLNDGSKLTPLVGHQAGTAIQAIKFDPDHRLVATASYDSKVRLFVLDNLQQEAITFSEHTSWVLDLCFNKRSALLASSSKDKSIRIYPTDIDAMVAQLTASLQREMTLEEWNMYVGSDIEKQQLLN